MSKHLPSMTYVFLGFKVLAALIALYYLSLVIQYYQKPLYGPGSNRDTMGDYAMAPSSSPSFFRRVGEAMMEAAVIMIGYVWSLVL
jgi:hypothetical protein